MTVLKIPIVGIKGSKGSGKDTVASMIHYILAVGTTIANLDGWKRYNMLEKDELDVPTLHFADALKEQLSMMFHIERSNFDNPEYKDCMYYSFDSKGFINNTVKDSCKLPEITIEDLQTNTLVKWRESYYDKCVIKLRTLMQYYGTEIIRNQLGENIWIDICIRKAIAYSKYYGYSVIADVRFNNESAAIREFRGQIIKVVRNKSENEHISENISEDNRDYVIENNGTLMGLFFKVLQFVKDEMM